MRTTHTAQIVVGQVVETARWGRAAVVEIHGEQRPRTIEHMGSGAMVSGGNAHFDLVYYSGARSKSVPESIMCGGLPWRILDIVISQAEIDDLLVAAQARELEEAEKKAAEDAAYALEKIRLRNCPEYKHLTTTDNHNAAVSTLVAKNIRAELKKTFPGVKFSVKKHSYDSVGITWTDGPTTAEVEAVTDKYEDGKFNSMEDIYEYNRSAFTDIFGGVKYVNTRREYSDEFVTKGIEKTREKFGIEHVPAFCNVEKYRSGELHNVGREFFTFGLNREIGLLMSEMKA
ncbi:hypothetical protein QPR65_22705 (plasmid) [Enterobacter hormaechei]|uniref:LPD29 domain-containing protein n=1 Tax=Enterobacter hormaechei TaxID=158836 RepID=UPI0027D22429|nr:LPD29 domain-containing protein [Enterobacter hormaechei]WLZ51947.1 hypothetical protein QPR65_22705 [Enterobacter hormaechei]